MKTICSKIDSTKFRLASGLWPKMSFEFCFNILINRVKNFGEVAAWNGVVPCDVACSFHGGCACRFSIMRLAHLKRYDRRIFKDWGVHVHLGADLEGRFIFKKWKNINQLIGTWTDILNDHGNADARILLRQLRTTEISRATLKPALAELTIWTIIIYDTGLRSTPTRRLGLKDSQV